MALSIKTGVKLSDYCTFKIGGRAKYFAVIENEADLLAAIAWAKRKHQKIFVLGGGSNTLFPDRDFSALVLKNEIKGLKISGENEKQVIVKAYSGEIWSKLVRFALDRSYFGLENTFCIPGTVGAAPIQNIGAYGVELKDVFYNLKAVDLTSGQARYFNLPACRLSYRHSIFKDELKGKYFILWLEVRLNKEKKLNLDYPDIKENLAQKNIANPDLKQLAEAIMEVRNGKLPNPAVLPNAGSFFKNPVVSPAVLADLKNDFPDIKYFSSSDQIKIPAAWLIDRCGFKERKFGPVGVYERQALIIVNHGGARQSDVLKLAEMIKREVKKKFGLKLESEVNII